MTRRKRRRSPVRRALRGVIGLIVACTLFTVVGAYIPFARCPSLDPETARAVEARADEMQNGIDTPDRAMLIEDSAAALDERIRLIAQAREEIVLATYECYDGESTRDVLSVLLERADAGVRVRILIDGIRARLELMPSALFRAVAVHPNVEVRFYNLFKQVTAWRHMGRMHDKYVIVDDTAYILGGRNTSDTFLGRYPAPYRSLDREALIYNGAHGDADAGSSLAALREYFEGVWAMDAVTEYRPLRRISDQRRDAVYEALGERCRALRAARPELFEPCDYAERTLPTDGVWLVSNPTTIYAKQPVVFAQLCALMRRAQRDVVVHSPYAVLNADMRGALSEIAASVPVTLMVNAAENGANVVACGDYLYHRPEVLATGVRLLEYAGGDSYHGKALAIDGDISVIGCFNLDLRSTYVDTELMLVIRGTGVNARLRANMDALHADCRRVIDADTAVVPEGLEIPPLSLRKRLALRVAGALVQPIRNLV